MWYCLSRAIVFRRESVMPGVSVSTRNIVMPPDDGATPDVRATTSSRFAVAAYSTNIFSPFRTKPPSTAVARVLMPRGS
jgi:hypothetical protein